MLQDESTDFHRLEEGEEMRAQLILKINRLAKEGKKIPCKKALELAKEFSVEPKEIGDILNKLEIKIIDCSLGCF
ncbi:MAG: hypothetical protein QME40_02680 [bacterium]|nr:hypothetical protein [bacterium]